MLLPQSDHARRIFVLASVIVLLVVGTGLYGIYLSSRVKQQFYHLVEKDLPFLSDGASVIMLQTDESNIIDRAMRLRETSATKAIAENAAILQREFDRTAAQIAITLGEGLQLAEEINRRHDAFAGEQADPYLSYLLRAQREHQEYVDQATDLLKAIAQGDWPAAERLYAVTTKEANDLRVVFRMAILESELLTRNAARWAETFENETLRGLLLATALASLVGIWMVYLIRLVMRARYAAERQLEEQAIRDALTGLYNRRYFSLRLNEALHYAARHGQPLSLCICDLDRFKHINDTYGHQIGDQVLQRFAHIAREEIRAEDLPARLGGDEFVILFPDTAAHDSKTVAERIRHRFGREEFVHDGHALFQASATFGVADYHPLKPDEKTLIEAADRALYRAKELGRNCVVTEELAPQNEVAQ